MFRAQSVWSLFITFSSGSELDCIVVVRSSSNVVNRGFSRRECQNITTSFVRRSLNHVPNIRKNVTASILVVKNELMSCCVTNLTRGKLFLTPVSDSDAELEGRE